MPDYDRPPEPQPSGFLDPPRRNPPTAVGAAMEEPEPRRERTVHSATMRAFDPAAVLRLPFVLVRAAVRATRRALAGR